MVLVAFTVVDSDPQELSHQMEEYVWLCHFSEVTLWSGQWATSGRSPRKLHRSGVSAIGQPYPPEIISDHGLAYSEDPRCLTSMS
jgi:hypothetical protein